MNIEYWAHWVVSVIALIASIGIPLWQWRRTSAQTIASKRTLLFQRILSVKSVGYTSMWELMVLLNGGRMKPQRRANAEKMLQSLQEHHDALEVLHAEWSNYDDVTTLSTLEQALSDVDVTSSDAEDTAKLVVHFVKASLHTN